MKYLSHVHQVLKYIRKQENKKTKNIIQYFNLYFERIEMKPNITKKNDKNIQTNNHFFQLGSANSCKQFNDDTV